MILIGTQESSRGENPPSDHKATTIRDAKGKRVDSAIQTGTQESSEDSSFAHKKEAKPIESMVEITFI